MPVERNTVDLSGFPDLVVVYLGLRVNAMAGLRRLAGLGPQIRNSGGTGFWHETYAMRGGMEAIYVDVPVRTGFAAFAPVILARGRMFGARARIGTDGTAPAPVISESDLGGPL